tara:strand:- start:2921 stop:4858 length:1938 start_codon:yes stop_codon:yes gene_type:complete
MSIKRFFANADNTITNAFASNLTTRGTGSNMGASDILEVFSIYGQGSSTSVEKARAMVQFDVSKIKAARDAGTIAQSGSVNFMLRLFNAEHGQTLPKNCTLAVLPLSQSWSEGNGLDMEEYADLDVSNWIFASNNKVADITDVKFVSTTPANYDGKYFILQVLNDDKTTTRHNFWFDDDGAGTAPSQDGTEVEVQINQANANTVKRFAREVKVAVDALVGTNLSASISEEDTDDSTGATVRLTNTAIGGTSGSFTPTVHDDSNVFTLTRTQRGGKTRWTSQGGDFHEVGYTAGKNLPHYKFDLLNGTEDVLVNVTALVEEWIAAESTVDPDRENYGVMIKLSGSFEDGTRQRSYYTKKFFARGTEFFFKRPCIEARFNDHIGDDRENFYKSSSLATGPENLNQLYMYNYTRRGLTNMPVLKTDPNGADQSTGEALLKVRLYPELKSTARPITLPLGGGVGQNNREWANGYLSETGIYSASIAYTGSATKIYDVWSDQSDNELFTGSAIYIKEHKPLPFSNADEEYVVSLSNLKPYYRTKDKPSLRLNIRKKDYQPNIYTVASNKIQSEVLYNVYYRAYRVIDEQEVISYGSGSIPHTKMSYDSSGSYFKVDMSLFEPGYMYAIEISTDSYGQNIVNKSEFKFRVE